MESSCYDISFVLLVLSTIILNVSSADQLSCQPQLYPPHPTTGCCGHDSYSLLRDIQNVHNSLGKAWDGENQDRPVNVSSSLENLNRRISAGKEMELGRFPWMVYLELTMTDGIYICAGSLISAVYILTAAHCVHRRGLSLHSIKVVIDEHNLQSFPFDCKYIMGNQQCINNIAIQAENVVYNSLFDDRYLHNDIAIIKIPNTVYYARFIQPICLPTFDINKPEFANTPIIISGWGNIDEVTPSYGVKLFAEVLLMTSDTCRQYYDYILDSQICSIGLTGQDHCGGDSGGPVMLQHEGIYYLVGIISGKDIRTFCGSSLPSSATHVFHYIPWINKQLGLY